MVRRIRQPAANRTVHVRDHRVRPVERPDERPAGPVSGSADAVTAAAAILKELLRDRELEQARLEGVRLTAREMAHLLNNDLAVAIGLVELLQDRSDLPIHVREVLDGTSASLDSAARHIARFQAVVRVATKQTPAGWSLDLERSSQRE